MFTLLLNWSNQAADIVGKIFSSVSFPSLNVSLIFDSKNVLTEVGRKVVMEPVFSMDRGFKAQL